MSAKHVVSKLVAAWSVTSTDEFVALFTVDGVYEDVPFGRISHGCSEIRDFYEQTRRTFPDLTVSAISVITEGSRACVNWVMSGTHLGELPGIPATGNKMSVRGVSLLELNAENIARCSDYYDAADLARQLRG